MLDYLSIRFLLLSLLTCQVAFGQQPASLPPSGHEIFFQRCAKCHGEKGEGISASITIAGPNIQAEHNFGDVMAAMEIGPDHMPQFPYVLTVGEMRTVAGYVTQDLATIPLAGGDLNEGGHLFRIYCSACHTAAARGGALAFTGVNAPDISGKSAALIAGAIRWGPGPMPAFPASVITDQQLDSIVEYVNFLRRPPSPGGTPLHWIGPVAEGFVAWVILFGLVMVSGWIEKGGKG